MYKKFFVIFILANRILFKQIVHFVQILRRILYMKYYYC